MVDGTVVDGTTGHGGGFLLERGAEAADRGRRREGPSRIAGDVLRIGRGTDAHLRFEDPAVALAHAHLERRGDGLFAVDLGSVTGTYVNGEKVTETRIEDGDRLDIGGHGLSVRAVPGEPVVVRVAPRVAATAPVAATRPGGAAGPAVRAEAVDYVAAYRLRRRAFGKAALSLAAVGLAVAAVFWVSRPHRVDAFRPGELAAAHAREIPAWNCTACHAPWQGSVDSLCADCHGQNQVAHQAVQASTPGCTTCHREHQGRERVQVVSDGDCTSCHGDLRSAAEAAPRFAAAVTSFAEHPGFAVDSPAGRVPLAEAVDPGTVAVDHALHLAPGLLSPGAPGGRETLTCESCHRVTENGEDLAPIDYEAHCGRCHGLEIGSGLPPAPHVEPMLLRDLVIGALIGVERGAAADGGGLEERRRRAVAGVARLSPERRRDLLLQADRVEATLYASACTVCHAVDLDAEPVPAVAPPAIDADWLPYSHFFHATHLDHTDLACVDCHTEAATSRATADVLLPSLDTCQPCHGDAATSERRAASSCADCHSYHPSSRNRRAAASGDRTSGTGGAGIP